MQLIDRFLPHGTKYDFIRYRWFAFCITAVLIIGSFASIAIKGFNFGIDFAGGILLEAQSTTGPADLHGMRTTLGHLGLGEVSLQEFGTTGRDVMIRVQRQEGDEKTQMAALSKVKASLGEGFTYRRVEIVGPKVGGELVRDGVLAVVLALGAIALYVWFRFEWQFGVGALVSTFHDVITTFGLFSITGLEFNLTTVAAILTIAGYSVNDTVVEYDRVRENLRKFKTMSLYDLLNLAVNETLARTILTVSTVFVTVLALLFVGGEVLRGFSIAMLWGLIIGTFSSIYVAMPMLIYFNLRTGKAAEEAEAEEAPTGGPAAP
ncbi:protein translocase subunit SecF [Paramagnetospirillum magneticum]|uniref:Protein-export membrane protein SecF n=1 Tax=Paramagnetospirillum magneticum (strain ATCC 700264 / AMB-1) TaxID=342108 RepID=Q2W4A8_PARM1|nr:protein translocase subunit SecF [Paramagnetospirillum magneticum]BAE51317.1 Preprotein translocase subunit SecF [Paramagnetospirillum magneticum AMB-1]